MLFCILSSRFYVPKTESHEVQVGALCRRVPGAWRQGAVTLVC